MIRVKLILILPIFDKDLPLKVFECVLGEELCKLARVRYPRLLAILCNILVLEMYWPDPVEH